MATILCNKNVNYDVETNHEKFKGCDLENKAARSKFVEGSI